jgi:hypothetical protein
MAFDHPSVRHFGFPIQLQVIGASPIEKRGPVCKLTLTCQHWLRPSGKAQSATVTPTSAVRNKRAEAAAKKNPPNPQPSQQSKVGDPPLNYTPG